MRSSDAAFDSEQFRALVQTDVAHRMEGMNVERLLPVNLVRRYIGLAAVIVVGCIVCVRAERRAIRHAAAARARAGRESRPRLAREGEGDRARFAGHGRAAGRNDPAGHRTRRPARQHRRSRDAHRAGKERVKMTADRPGSFLREHPGGARRRALSHLRRRRGDEEISPPRRRRARTS